MGQYEISHHAGLEEGGWREVATHRVENRQPIMRATDRQVFALPSDREDAEQVSWAIPCRGKKSNPEGKAHPEIDPDRRSRRVRIKLVVKIPQKNYTSVTGWPGAVSNSSKTTEFNSPPSP